MPRWDFSNGENKLVVSSPTFSEALNSVEPSFINVGHVYMSEAVKRFDKFSTNRVAAMHVQCTFVWPDYPRSHVRDAQAH
jgi:hypothetical protein